MSILTRFRVRCNMLLQMSKSPVEKPAATHRGAEQPPTPRLAEKLEVKMMACGDDTLETSPVEQQFVQRKQKYSSPLCQGKHLSQVFSEIIACDCQWRVQLSSLFTLAHPGFPRSFSERGRISKSLKWSKNSAAPSTPKLRESTAQPPLLLLLDNYYLSLFFFLFSVLIPFIWILVASYFVTAYRMGVLASREHTCIHPEVSRSSNKNEGCKTLNDPRLARQNQQKVKETKYATVDRWFRRRVGKQIGTALNWKRGRESCVRRWVRSKKGRKDDGFQV